MKLLREVIRKIILAESAMGPSDLPPGIFIRFYGDSEVAEFEFVKKPLDAADTEISKKDYVPSGVSDGARGSIQIYRTGEEKVGPCRDAWMVSWAGTTEGFGPMLYDLAMEYATENGGGLIADRGTVSRDARKVWDFYLAGRSGDGGDVEALQLDDVNNSLTQDIEEDNCDQEVAGGSNWMYPTNPNRINPNWPKSALSKIYKKSPSSMTKTLRDLKRLIE